MSGLQVDRLSKELAGNTIVDDVSFEIADAEFFVLLGPSGGGKTTILRLICGLEAPDSGTIVIDGRDVTTSPPRERNIGMVFQEYGLYPNMDVFHNVAYGLEARGVPKAEVQRARHASGGGAWSVDHARTIGGRPVWRRAAAGGAGAGAGQRCQRLPLR